MPTDCFTPRRLAAVLTLDPANSTATGNFGAAIVTYGEDSLATMADFIEELDQGEASKLRAFVRNVTAEATYQAPDLHDILQYGSLDAFSQPHARAVFQGWAERWGKRDAAPLAVKQAAAQIVGDQDVRKDYGVNHVEKRTLWNGKYILE